MNLFCQFKNLWSKFRIFLVHLFNKIGLKFWNLFIFRFGKKRIFGSKWQISVAIWRRVPIRPIKRIPPIFWWWTIKFLLQFLNLLLTLLNFLHFLVSLVINTIFQRRNFFHKLLHLFLVFNDDIVFAFDEIICLLNLNNKIADLRSKSSLSFFEWIQLLIESFNWITRKLKFCQ